MIDAPVQRLLAPEPAEPILSYPRGSVPTMPIPTRYQPAALGQFFIERANAGPWLPAIDRV
jgi:hypothetical protein